MRIKRYRHKEYNRHGAVCYLDPIRNMLVQATPEEAVRQGVVRSLISGYGYPDELLATEYHLRRNRLRADIVVFLSPFEKEQVRDRRALIVVECKGSGVMLTDDCVSQGITYCKHLRAPFLVVTNGDESLAFACDRTGGSYRPIRDIPTYSQALREKWVPSYLPDPTPDDRPTMDKLSNRRWLWRQFRKVYSDWIIGVDTPEHLWSLIVNLTYALWDRTPYFHEPISWAGYEFIEDLGVSRHEFGNAGGGKLGGDFRSFIVRDTEGNDRVVRLTVMSLPRLTRDPRFGNQKGRTYLNVAVCDGEKQHDSLELCLDTFTAPVGHRFRFWHDGRIAVGNMGQLPMARVLEYIKQKVPHMVSGSEISLGAMPNDRVLAWNDIRELVLNLAVYGILRDDIRDVAKAERQARV